MNIQNKLTIHLRQVAPHQQDREQVQLLYESLQVITQLKQQIEEAKNCLVCATIADPAEVCENTLNILEDKLP